MVGLAERPSWIPVADMVLPGSIGAKLIPGISDLEERERPDTTFNQSFTLPSFTRQNPDLITYGDILRLPPEELDKFDPGFRLRERLTDYLEGHLILPHSRLLQAVYDIPQFPAPARQEPEIVKGVEDALNQMEYKNWGTVLILRFGLYDGIIHTLEEIGRGFNPEVTRERIRQLETKGFRILRYPTRADIRGYLVIPENSFGREVFGAVLENDLSELDGRASTEALHLPSDVIEALKVNRIPLVEYFSYPFRKIRDLVSKDLSTFDDTPVFSWIKQEIASALQRRVAEVIDKRRVEAEQKALVEAQRRARIGELRNNLMVEEVELSTQQLERLDEVLLEELGLRTLAYNTLERDGIKTVGELLRMNRKKLRGLWYVGPKTEAEIIEKLTTFLKSQ